MGLIKTTAPNLQGKARVDLVKSDFDAIVWQKGYDVILEKAIECPCRNRPDGQALSDCRNCGGSGWVFYNPVQTRMVIQSINKDTQYKEWSKENLGTAKISALNEQQLSYMDKITILNAVQTLNETLFFKQHSDGVYRAMSTYKIIDIVDIFEFVDSQHPLKVLTENDYTIVNERWIELSNVTEQYPTISIRYTYNPIYHILDINRDVMTSKKLIAGKDINKDFPVSAVGRVAHYILNIQNFNQEYLFDNSYDKGCGTESNFKRC